jgi:hypothetical protein
MLAIPPAELLHLDPLAIVQLVLGGDVVPSLAYLARQRDLHPFLVLRHARSFFLTARETAPAW